MSPDSQDSHWGHWRNIDLAIFVVVLIALPFMLTSYSALRTLVFIGTNSIAALGLVLLIGYTGQVSLGHAGFIAVGAYGSAILTTQYGWSPWLAMLMGTVVTSCIAYIVGAACLRLRGHYLVIATLAFGQMVSILLIEQEEFTRGVMGIAGIPALNIFGLRLTNDLRMYYLIWGIVALLALFAKNLTSHRHGRALHRIRTSEVQAYALGINVPALKIRMFVLSAVLASLAGSLYAHAITAIGPEEFSLTSSMNLLIMVVLGGRFSPWGGVFGALLVIGLPQLIRGYESYSVALFGVLLVAVLLFFPGGLAAGIGSVIGKVGSFVSIGKPGTPPEGQI